MFPFVKKVMNNTSNKEYFIEKIVAEAWRDRRIITLHIIMLGFILP